MDFRLIHLALSAFEVLTDGIRSLFGLSESVIRILGVIFFSIFFLIFLAEFLKYLKHDVHDESLDLSIMGAATFATLAISADILLAILVGIFVMTIIETCVMWDYPIWNKLILITTVFYSIILGSYILSEIYDDNRIFGIGLTVSFWVMLILGFALFGKRYILTSRFLSPQYLYLFLYLIAYLIIWRFRSLGHIYETLFVINVLIYLVSGPVLKRLMGIKSLEDDRICGILREMKDVLGVRGDIDLGIVHAPILNAFAYGPFFDKRIAVVCDDPSEFTDDEWRGIIGHELAHLKENHLLLLLFVIGAELWFRKIFEIPATFYDYAFAQQTMSFLVFYLIGVVLGVIILLFARTMEGRADRAVRKIGYGPQLAKALYSLEGFYTGIGGAAGISARLLSGEKITEEDYQIAMFHAARSLRKFLIRPSKLRAAIDLFMSHPHSSLRLAALLKEDLSPTKCALLPWVLVAGRGGKTLKNHVFQVEDLLNEKYRQRFGKRSVQKLLEIAELEHQYAEQYKDQNCIAIPFSTAVGEIITGKVIEIKKGESVIAPVLMSIETTTDSERKDHGKTLKVINPADYRFEIYDVGSDYLLPNGFIGNLKGYLAKFKEDKPTIFLGLL